MDPDQFQCLKQLFCRAADEELLGRFNRVMASFKADGSAVTPADLAMQQRMQDELARAFPDYGFLGEEMDSESQARALATPSNRLWVLDPLDGTSNFAMGIPYFAASLALVQDQRVRVALVYDPVRRECFHASPGAGAWLNGQRLGRRLPATPLAKGIGLVDLKRLPGALAQRLAVAPPYASQRSFGSVALDFCWLAAGRVHVYLHGRHNLWDYAAGLSILHQAGGQSMTLDGVKSPPLDLHPRSSVAALDAELFREWCCWLGL